MPKVGDLVKLKKPSAQSRLPTGAEGTIVTCFKEPSEGYEVEFLDDKGYTKAILTLEPGDFEIVWTQE